MGTDDETRPILLPAIPHGDCASSFDSARSLLDFALMPM
jgi:hypothetical protein